MALNSVLFSLSTSVQGTKVQQRFNQHWHMYSNVDECVSSLIEIK